MSNEHMLPKTVHSPSDVGKKQTSDVLFSQTMSGISVHPGGDVRFSRTFGKKSKKDWRPGTKVTSARFSKSRFISYLVLMRSRWRFRSAVRLAGVGGDTGVAPGGRGAETRKSAPTQRAGRESDARDKSAKSARTTAQIRERARDWRSCRRSSKIFVRAVHGPPCSG